MKRKQLFGALIFCSLFLMNLVSCNCPCKPPVPQEVQKPKGDKTVIVISGTVREITVGGSSPLAGAAISIFDASTSSNTTLAMPVNSVGNGTYPNSQVNNTETHPSIMVIAKKLSYTCDAILYFDNTYSFLPQPKTDENFLIKQAVAPEPTTNTLKVILVGNYGSNYNIHVNDDNGVVGSSPNDQLGISWNGSATFNILRGAQHNKFTIRVSKNSDTTIEKSVSFYVTNITVPATLTTTLNIPF